MYAYIEGQIIEKFEQRVIVQPDGMGVGFVVNVASRTLTEIPAPGESVRLYTSFQVREDSQTLFGFSTPAERDLFEALLKISGIGGKTAIAILDLPRERIVAAIAAGDSEVLRTVPGIGAKTAGRIVLELKDKFAKELMEEWAESVTSGRDVGGAPIMGSEGRGFAEAVEALVGLGYQRADATSSVRHARQALGDEASPEELVRYALKH